MNPATTADQALISPRSARALLADPKRRYVLIAAVGFLPIAIETLRGSNQIFDFWEYAATARQLMLHTGNPGNPLLAVHTASAFFSPYLLAVALLGNATGTGPVHTLALAGVINYWLWIWATWRFTRLFSSHPMAPVYGLVFIWLLWGPGPWKYSGFFDYRVLPDAVAYPSTFGTAIGMLLASYCPQMLATTGGRAIAAAAGVAVVLAGLILTHPIAADMTLAAMLCVALTAEQRRRAILALVGVGIAAGLLCLAWPYFSFTALVRDQRAYDPSNQAMYGGWVVHAAPAFLALGLYWYRTASLRRDRLVIYSAPLIALYLYGGLSGHYSQGRAISPLIMGLQLGLADAFATFVPQASVRLGQRAARSALALVALAGAAELVNNGGGLRASFPGTGSPRGSYAAYKQAVNGLPVDATVATPLNDGQEAAIPVYAGRLVATHRALAFVSDQEIRAANIAEFFAPTAPATFRQDVISSYHVRYIVVPTAAGAVVGQLAAYGTVIRRGATFDTIQVASQR